MKYTCEIVIMKYIFAKGFSQISNRNLDWVFFQRSSKIDTDQSQSWTDRFTRDIILFMSLRDEMSTIESNNSIILTL